MKSDIVKQIETSKIIAIMDGFSPDMLLYTVEALQKGGINCFQIPFNLRSPEKERECLIKIAGLKKCFGKDITVGAGNVITDNAVKLSKGAGADFVCSPCIKAEVLSRASALNIAAISSAFTTTEVEDARVLGADMVQLLPTKINDNYDFAQLMVKTMPHIKFIGSGNLGFNDIAPLNKIGINTYSVQGSLANLELAQKREYEIITNEAKRYVELLNKL